jgi:hypothetical protein
VTWSSRTQSFCVQAPIPTGRNAAWGGRQLFVVLRCHNIHVGQSRQHQHHRASSSRCSPCCRPRSAHRQNPQNLSGSLGLHTGPPDPMPCSSVQESTPAPTPCPGTSYSRGRAPSVKRRCISIASRRVVACAHARGARAQRVAESATPHEMRDKQGPDVQWRELQCAGTLLLVGEGVSCMPAVALRVDR